MQAPVELGALTSDEDWLELAAKLRPARDVAVLRNLLATFRDLGAQSFLLEGAYIDRDFSAAHAAFYTSLFHPYLKYCRRLHLFDEDLSDLQGMALGAVPVALEQRRGAYLGFVVLRPVNHAPVGAAVVSATKLTRDPAIQVDVRARFDVHLLGADFEVEGFPLTQQDRRVGACAQAAIWMAGRHFHRRHGGPWYSMPEVNEAAIKPTDNVVSRSLPAGSEFLAPDNIVRALRAMERHPVVHFGRPEKDSLVWLQPPQDVIARYLDSGIPVILGLRGRDGANVGHAVVAIGRVQAGEAPDQLPPNATAAQMATHIIVADDQRGVYCRLPIKGSDRTDDYPWTLEEDALYAIVPLPSKVYVTAEAAEVIARRTLEALVNRIDEFRDLSAKSMEDGAALKAGAEVDTDFFSIAPQALVARTYLTYGWKYKRRALRNRLTDEFKAELVPKQLPRYVWVTEFSLPGDLTSLNACDRRVRAHVVVDATGSQFWESTLVAQVPGLAMFWTFNPANPLAPQELVWSATNTAEPFLPKVRGWRDYEACPIPPPVEGEPEAGS